MDLKRFYEVYNPRVRHHASTLVSLYKMPASEIDDLSNAGYIGISECLHKYDESRSPCIYAYCFRNMKRSMMGVVREYFGNKPQVSRQIVFLYSDSELSPEISDKTMIDIEMRIDLSRMIDRSYSNYPVQTQRFIDSIINERSGQERASKEGVSRMAIHQSVKAVQKRLQKEFKHG